MSEYSPAEYTNYPEECLNVFVESLNLYDYSQERHPMLSASQLQQAERFLHSAGVTTAFGAGNESKPVQKHIDGICLDAYEQDAFSSAIPVALSVVVSEATFNPASTLDTRQKEDLLWKMRSMQKDLYNDSLQGNPAYFVQLVEFFGTRMINKVENDETYYSVFDDYLKESRQLLRQFAQDGKWENRAFGNTAIELVRRGTTGIRTRLSNMSRQDANPVDPNQ